MKSKIQLMLALAAVGLVAGCVSDGLSYHERPGVTYPNYILSLQPKQPSAMPDKPATPIRLAVAQVGESAPSQMILKKLASDPMLVSSVVALPLPGETERYSDARTGKDNQLESFATRIESVCRLAQSAGADYLFIIGGNVDSWQNQNALAVLDLTIIGGFIFPSHEIKMEGKAAGTLIKTASAEPVMFVNVDTKTSGSAPSYLADGKREKLQATTRDNLANALADEFLRQLARKKAVVAVK